MEGNPGKAAGSGPESVSQRNSLSLLIVGRDEPDSSSPSPRGGGFSGDTTCQWNNLVAGQAKEEKARRVTGA